MYYSRYLRASSWIISWLLLIFFVVLLLLHEMKISLEIAQKRLFTGTTDEKEDRKTADMGTQKGTFEIQQEGPNLKSDFASQRDLERGFSGAHAVFCNISERGVKLVTRSRAAINLSSSQSRESKPRADQEQGPFTRSRRASSTPVNQSVTSLSCVLLS